MTRTPFEERRLAEARRLAKKRALLALLFAGPPALAAALAYSPVLDVDTVEVTGTRRTSVEVVRDVGQVRDGAPLLTVDTDGMRERIARLPTVRRVTVTRSWPSTLRIEIVERDPVVAVRRPGRYDLHDIDGFLVETVRELPADTPALTVRGEPTREVVTATVGLLRALTPELREQVRGLRADANGLLSFRLADGAEVVWGSAERAPEKVRALTLLVKQKAKRYDVRVPDRPAVVPR